MQVCHDLLNKYEAESDGFKDCIITGDKMRCHHYDPKSKWESMEWQRWISPLKKKFKTQPSVGKVMFSVFWDRKGEVLLGFLEPRQTTDSDCYIATPTKLKAPVARIRPEKITFLLSVPTPVRRPWSTLAVLPGLSYHTHHIVQMWCLLTSTFWGWWKMDCVGNISLGTVLS